MLPKRTRKYHEYLQIIVTKTGRRLATIDNLKQEAHADSFCYFNPLLLRQSEVFSLRYYKTDLALTTFHIFYDKLSLRDFVEEKLKEDVIDHPPTATFLTKCGEKEGMGGVLWAFPCLS